MDYTDICITVIAGITPNVVDLELFIVIVQFTTSAKICCITLFLPKWGGLEKVLQDSILFVLGHDMGH